MKKKRTFLPLLIIVALLAVLLPTSAVLAGTPYQKGDVFVGIGNGQIEHYAPDGTLIQTLDNGTGSFEQTGMAFDASGYLLTTDFTNQSMSEFDSDGDFVAAFASGYSFNLRPESVVFDGAGDLYVGQVDGGPSRLTKFDRTGAMIQEYFLATEDRGIDWIDLAADQKTMFYTSEGYDVMRYDLDADAQLPKFATLPERPAYALRIRSNGEVLVAATTNVYRLDPSGGIMQTYPIPAGNSVLFALNLDPDGTSFWTAGYNSRNVYKIDIDTGSILTSFTAGGTSTVAGLAIFGEPTASQVPQPTIRCRCPNFYFFAATEDGENPESQTMTIYNFGDEGCAPLEWTVSAGADWLVLSPTSGTQMRTMPGAQVDISVDISDMGAGRYFTWITVEAPGATNTPQQVPVILHIRANYGTLTWL